MLTKREILQNFSLITLFTQKKDFTDLSVAKKPLIDGLEFRDR